MADLSQTISNSINCFGISETQKWGSAGLLYPMTWGASNWGERGVYTEFSFGITVDNDIASDSDVTKDMLHVLSVDIESAMETGSETIQTRNGWYYVFTRPSTNAEDRTSNTYSSLTVAAVVYTSGTGTSTSWSSA